MATRTAVRKYAHRWLAESPGLSEADLRVRLEGRFLAGGPEGPAAAGAAGGVLHGAAAAPDASGAGCLFAFALAPAMFFWRLVFPAKPTDPAVIEDVLAELRDERAARDQPNAPRT